MIYYAPSLAPHVRRPMRRALTVSRTRRDGPRPTAASGTQQPVRTKPSGSRQLRPPRGSPATRGGTAGAGPARATWMEDAPPRPPRVRQANAHQTASNRIKLHQTGEVYYRSTALQQSKAGFNNTVRIERYCVLLYTIYDIKY